MTILQGLLRRPLRLFHRLAEDRRGATAVQFGLILPAFLLLIVGGLDVGRLLWTQTTLQFASEEGGRYAMTHVTATSTQLINFTRQKLVGLDKDSVTVATANDTVGGVIFVTISTTHQFRLVTPFLSFATVQLSGRTRVPLIS